jgi:hypothetical protein
MDSGWDCVAIDTKPRVFRLLKELLKKSDITLETVITLVLMSNAAYEHVGLGIESYIGKKRYSVL